MQPKVPWLPSVVQPGQKTERCPRCGAPWTPRNAPGCGRCARFGRPFAFTHAAALWHYRAAARRVVHAFKYGGREDLLAPLGRLLAAAVRPGVLAAGPPAPLVVPVPARRASLRRRALFVREVESEHEAEVEVRLRTRGAKPGEPFERSVVWVASEVAALLDAGSRVALCTDDERIEAGSGARQRARLLAYLALVAPSHDASPATGRAPETGAFDERHREPLAESA